MKDCKRNDVKMSYIIPEWVWKIYIYNVKKPIINIIGVIRWKKAHKKDNIEEMISQLVGEWLER